MVGSFGLDKVGFNALLVGADVVGTDDADGDDAEGSVAEAGAPLVPDDTVTSAFFFGTGGGGPFDCAVVVAPSRSLTYGPRLSSSLKQHLRLNLHCSRSFAAPNRCDIQRS